MAQAVTEVWPSRIGMSFINSQQSKGTMVNFADWTGATAGTLREPHTASAHGS